MINCLIVDDEPLARDVIRLHLSNFPGWNVVRECVNATEAFEAMMAAKIDVLFLDIQMPRILGTDFLRTIKDPPKTVFTTAHAGFAIEGFDLNAVDYLLKPITFARFQEAVRKVEIALGVANSDQRFASVPEKIADQSFMFVKHDNRQTKINFHDILFLEAKRDFTLIQLKEKKLLAGFNLKMLEKMLPSPAFMRIHRSYIVRIDSISSLYGNVVEISNFQIPVSSAHKEALLQVLRLSPGSE